MNNFAIPTTGPVRANMGSTFSENVSKCITTCELGAFWYIWLMMLCIQLEGGDHMVSPCEHGKHDPIRWHHKSVLFHNHTAKNCAWQTSGELVSYLGLHFPLCLRPYQKYIHCVCCNITMSIWQTWSTWILPKFQRWSLDFNGRSIALFPVGSYFFPSFEHNIMQHNCPRLFKNDWISS